MNEPDKPTPEQWLETAEREEAGERRGRLLIFLGMCPGVGKTWAMLQAARQRQAEGLSVLVGVVETHGRAETTALLDGLETLPRRRLEHRGHSLEEFDPDEALRRRPDLVLVDELAHTNAPGSRHLKRYQDVLELTEAGIDVYSTLNVQHIESLVDTVRQITGAPVQETVPDSVLDRADEVQLIDLGVDKLLERLAEGRIYGGERATTAADHFFTEGNLTALRELALRFTAEQVDRDLEGIRRHRRVQATWKTTARLLAAVGPSPYAVSLIRWTRRAASRLGCPWLVLWVEPSRALTTSEQDTLTEALGLARRLGAEVVSTTDDDVAAAVLRVARERNVSQIVVGKPEKRGLFRMSLADRIIAGSGEIDVCAVRPLAERKPAATPGRADPVTAQTLGQWTWAAVIVFSVASLCAGLLPFTGYTAVALIFLLTVLLSALRLGRGPVIGMAAAAALVWNYFFIPPRFTFAISKPEDMLMFGMFFVVALIMGQLTTRLRQRERAERARQRQTAALLRVTQSAGLSVEPDKGLSEALTVIRGLLGASLALLVRGESAGLQTTVHAASNFTPSAKERGVALWSFDHRQTAGRFTGTLPAADATWFPLRTATATLGVLGVMFDEDQRLDFLTRQMIESFVLQLALVLEKQHFIQAITRAEVLEKSEELRRTLLDSVSHELKTPLAVIRASLEGIGKSDSPYVSEIAEASARLQRVVDSLLHMARLESSAVQATADWCDVADVIAAARALAGPALARRELRVTGVEDIGVMKLDHALLSQALANILHNAAAYTPDGTAIELHVALIDGRELQLTVRDHGPGIARGEERRIFEKFHRAPGTPAGGTGLGLSIAQGFLRAQGGTVSAGNRPDGGAEFTVTLPVTPLPA